MLASASGHPRDEISPQRHSTGRRGARNDHQRRTPFIRADRPAGRAWRAAREHDVSHVGPSWIVPRPDCARDYGIAHRHTIRHHEPHAVGCSSSGRSPLEPPAAPAPRMNPNCHRGNAGLARERSALDRPELSCVDDDADRAPGLKRQADTGEPSPPVRPRMRGPMTHSVRSREFSRDRPRVTCSSASRGTLARITPPMRMISDEGRHLRPLLLG
jgi:hypothetical protein